MLERASAGAVYWAIIFIGADPMNVQKCRAPHARLRGIRCVGILRFQESHAGGFTDRE